MCFKYMLESNNFDVGMQAHYWIYQVMMLIELKIVLSFFLLLLNIVGTCLTNMIFVCEVGCKFLHNPKKWTNIRQISGSSSNVNQSQLEACDDSSGNSQCNQMHCNSQGTHILFSFTFIRMQLNWQGVSHFVQSAVIAIDCFNTDMNWKISCV